MNEDYVSYEVAKLLKEKEFKWKCDNQVVEKIPGTEREEWDEDECAYVTKTNCNIYPKPTLYMAQKWLRGVQGIHIVIDFKSKDSWYYRIYDLDDNELIKQSEGYFNTYEDALQAGILRALKSI